MKTKKVSQFSDRFVLIADGQGAENLLKSFGYDERFVDFDSFFVRVTDGEYAEVWGMPGIIPTLDKVATRLW